MFADYASVQNNVYADYQQERRAQAREDNLKILRRDAQILLAPGLKE